MSTDHCESVRAEGMPCLDVRVELCKKLLINRTGLCQAVEDRAAESGEKAGGACHVGP